MPTLTIRSSPSHGPETPTSYGRLLTTRSQSDILVPKPVKANLEFASPIKAQNIFLSAHDYSKPLTRSSSALTFDNYPLPQTPVRSTSAHNFVNGPVGDDLSSSPERLAGIEIQNILFQRALTESSCFVTPKSPAPMFKLVPTTPTVKRNLSAMFETFKSSTPSAEEQDDEEVKPNLDRSTSFPSMTSSRDSTSFYNMVDEDHHDVDTDSEEDIYSSEEEDDDEYYQEEPNFKMFGMYASDDEEQTPSSDGMYNFRSMTPPVRTENPLCFDDRFQHFSSSHVHDKKRYDIGVELGLFKFSPIPSQN